jgi:carboxyl-terminal processing protease
MQIPTPRRLRLWLSFNFLWLALLAGCGRAGMSPDEWRDSFQMPDPADFSTQNRVAAFQQAHAKLSAEYAFTDWKQISWDALYAKYLPPVTLASANNDPQAYLIALHGYLSELQDGHAALPRTIQNAALFDAVIASQSGGGYGLGLAELDDGTILAAQVATPSPAATAGIASGASILHWGGAPIGNAINTTDPGQLLAAAATATTAHQRLERLRLMTRAPVGTTVEVEFQNPGAATSQTALLTAVDDGLAWLSLVEFAPLPTAADEQAIISAKVLPSGYGYIRLTVLADLNNLQNYPDFIRTKFLSAINQFQQAGVPGLVLDIRGNHGGYDSLAAALCGAFYRTTAFYESTAIYDKRDGYFLPITIDDQTGELVDALRITPQAAYFSGPVVAIVNLRTISSGEGLALCVNALDRGAVVGFYGTRGSFGLAGGAITLPDNIVLHYPFGRSLDAHGVIQVDSRQGQGGVQPKFRVPKTYDNVMAYAGGDDVELSYAINVLTQLIAEGK